MLCSYAVLSQHYGLQPSGADDLHRGRVDSDSRGYQYFFQRYQKLFRQPQDDPAQSGVACGHGYDGA